MAKRKQNEELANKDFVIDFDDQNEPQEVPNRIESLDLKNLDDLFKPINHENNQEYNEEDNQDDNQVVLLIYFYRKIKITPLMTKNLKRLHFNLHLSFQLAKYTIK